MSLLLTLLLASPSFGPVHRCDDGPAGFENWLYRAEDSQVFSQETFLPQTAWDEAEPTIGGQIAACFGTGTPHGRDVILHHLPAQGEPRWPVLLVTGAGYSLPDTMSFLAVALARAGVPVYGLTFAHRHGDNFSHAEQIANAVALIQETERAPVAIVGYSKGGLAARIYTSHTADADFSAASAAYATHGTRFRGDVDLLVLLGAPNGGLDTPYRWSASSLAAALSVEAPDAPTAWTSYCPYGTANWWLCSDLSAQSITGEDGVKAFAGQAQLLADWSDRYALPGENASLGAYALQPDWWTTYYGGTGFQSVSPGLEEAIEAGGRTIERLDAQGVAPSVKLLLVAGGNPIIGIGSVGGAVFDAAWGDEDAAARRVLWEDLAESWLVGVFPWADQAFVDDLPRLYAGTAYLGEISGPSDGLVFIDSALAQEGLTRAGAVVEETHLFEGLGHAELPTAGTLAAQFFDDPEQAGLYEPRLAEKYHKAENQSVDWLVARLAARGAPVVEPDPDGGIIDPDAGVDGGALDGQVADEGVPLADGALDPDDGVPAPDAAPDPDDGIPKPDGSAWDARVDPDDGIPLDARVDPDDGVPLDAAHLLDEGTTPSGTAADDGCSQTPGRAGWSWTLGLLAACGLGRRRRR